MKYIFHLILTAIALASTLSAKDKLKVGFIGSFSGAAQIYGDAARNGFELALDEIGRDWITVSYEDDQFLPAKSVAAFRKLTSTPLDLVITIGSSPSNAVAPIAQAKGVPLIAWASDKRVSANRSYVVRSYPSGHAEGAAAAVEAKRLGYDGFGVFIAVNDYAISWKNGFISTTSKGSILLNEEIPQDINDFKPFLLRARSKEISHYVVCLDPGKSGVFAKQARELKIKDPIFGCEYLHDKAEIVAAKGALDDAWFPTVSVKEEFRSKYLKKYGNESVISGAANHYDLAHLLYDVNSKKVDINIIERLIQNGLYNGAVGSFDVRKVNGDQFFDIQLTIKKVKVAEG